MRSSALVCLLTLRRKRERGADIIRAIHTVRGLKSLLPLLQVSHLVYNFLYDALQLPHLGLQSRERLLVCNSTGVTDIRLWHLYGVRGTAAYL